MRAVQYSAPGEIDWVDTPVPGAPPDGLLLRVLLTTICGSDLHFLHDSPAESYPFAPGQSGHECVAVVEESAVAALPPGTRVLALVPRFDAFAEYVSAGAHEVIPLPDGLPLERAVLAQQLGTVVYCCRKLANVMDKRVAVVGQGPAGLFFTMLMSAMGAREVYGLDIVDRRLELATEVGATAAYDVRKGDAVERIREATGGHMVDVVVEAVGKAETINLCPQLVRQYGEVALFGVPKKDVLPIAMEAFLRGNLRIVTSAYAQREPELASFRLALEIIARERLDVSRLVSHRLPFSRLEEGMQLAESKRDGAVKVLLYY